MITIREISPALKASGLSSFLVSFNYNQQVIQAIKTIPVHIYHKKLQIWQIPAIYIAQCLDTLTKLDDITLSLRNQENQDFQPLTKDEISEFKIKPYQHQITAINFMLQKGRTLLLDGCGVGKSLQIMLYAQILKKRGIIQHCLIITGIAGLRANWQREIKKFSKQSAITIGKYITKRGTVRYKPMAERANQLKNKIDQFFILLNVQSVRDPKIVQAILKSQNSIGLIAFDEAHRIGAPDTAQFKNLMKLVSDYKVAATGTLIVNNPLSAFGSLRFTGNDNSTLTNFKAQYCQFGGFNDTQIVGYKNLSYLREHIQTCSIRRTLFDVRKDIPPLTIEVEYLQMEEDEAKFYEAIKEGVKEQADKIQLRANNLLALTTRLRQATACPGILTSQPVESSKVNRALQLIKEITEQGEKIVVLSVFKQPVYQLARQLQGYRFSVNTGDYSDGQVAANVARFLDDPEQQIFLGTFGKAGTGYSLNSSMYMVCIDTPYTYSLFQQGFQRIHRVNNQRPAFVKVLVTSGTIDQRVQQIVATKKQLGDYLVDGKQSQNISAELERELRQIILDL